MDAEEAGGLRGGGRDEGRPRVRALPLPAAQRGRRVRVCPQQQHSAQQRAQHAAARSSISAASVISLQQRAAM
eukprot:10520980-Alexandrium_andersonii.AAC.1